MAIEAIAFDLDGTLASPSTDRAELLAEAMAAAGVRNATDTIGRDEYVAAHTRNPAVKSRKPIFRDLLADRDADPHVAAETYREGLAESISPVAGARELLDRVAKSHDLGLVTDGPERAQREKLRQLGWTDQFDAVVITGELKTRKPDPAAFEALLTRLETQPESVVFVGDHADRDVAGAAAVGFRTVHVVAADDEPSNRADLVVPRADIATEIPRWLSQLR